MSHSYDIAIAGVRIVDPASGLDTVGSIGIRDGKIASIGQGACEDSAREVLDFPGMVALPGLIDLHTHLTSAFGGSDGGPHMLARAGVCTALDMAGPASDLLRVVREFGSGITTATLEAAIPEKSLSGPDPTEQELDRFYRQAMTDGALGAKLLGGHYPLTPEASRRLVAIGEKHGAYVAWHAGSTQHCNTIAALAEVLDLAEGRPVHVAHINSYCRGMAANAMDEVGEAVALLGKHPTAWSEAYLAETNGTTFELDDTGRIRSNSTGRILEHNGFPATGQGLEAALLAGFARLFVPRGLDTVLLTGDKAVAYWRRHGRAKGGFDVNPALPRVALCLARQPEGHFAVDAISTDGGAIPRNVMVSHGLALVKLGALSLADFVRKASYNPSRILHLPNKGHLAPGADADVTLVDLERQRPVMTMVGGKVCMLRGVVTGRGGVVVTTARGEATVRAAGLPALVVDPSGGPLPFR